MTHSADGLEMKFTHRTSWKGHIFFGGRIVDTVPISWTKGWWVDPNTKDIFLEVWFNDRTKLEQRALEAIPFNVAVGKAHDYEEMPHSFDKYQGLFNVLPTGEILSDISIQTKVLRRVKGEHYANRT